MPSNPPVIIKDQKHGLPMSKGLLAQTYMAAGLSPSRAYTAAQRVQDGFRDSGRFEVTLAEVRDAFMTLAESVEVLGRRSEEIGNIVDVITSIADQTNLLSLNAAIEAARAGESGRGFSVVAEEVRKLAEGSGKAAEQIGELIKDVQAETAKALKYMEIGSQEVVSGTEVVGRTGEALRQITEAVTRTATLAEEIAAGMASQAERTNDVDRAMHDIAAVVEENAASAEETAAAASDAPAAESAAEPVEPVAEPASETATDAAPAE